MSHFSNRATTMKMKLLLHSEFAFFNDVSCDAKSDQRRLFIDDKPIEPRLSASYSFRSWLRVNRAESDSQSEAFRVLCFLEGLVELAKSMRARDPPGSAERRTEIVG